MKVLRTEKDLGEHVALNGNYLLHFVTSGAVKVYFSDKHRNSIELHSYSAATDKTVQIQAHGYIHFDTPSNVTKLVLMYLGDREKTFDLDSINNELS
ncbi:hypothetical protein [Flexithrix dorotheae]|uniref:hypothetical protein n=1 Tax=Flexithrix dorotheae TaxID=70993 RepID=UPI00037FA216|nr:hypothetical protein [Flexithrix dorotheae]